MWLKVESEEINSCVEIEKKGNKAWVDRSRAKVLQNGLGSKEITCLPVAARMVIASFFDIPPPVFMVLFIGQMIVHV
jgi:hypothetical protein